MRDVLRGTWRRGALGWALASLAAVSVLGGVGYLALKVTPDLFASDGFGERPCRPDDETYKTCLDAARARAEDRRGVTTATLALFAGALSAFGAVYTARSFRQNREATDRRHQLDLDAHEHNRHAADRRHELDLQAHALNREAADRRHQLELDADARDQDRQITERFTRAIDQLGSPALDVRLGGIYALERIARDSRPDHPQIVEVLTAYVREHSPWPPGEAAAATETGGSRRSRSERATGEPPPLPTDVQAAMSVLGRRGPSDDGGRLDLGWTDLRRLVLRGEGARSSETPLDGPLRVVGHLERADLRGAHLERAVLTQAHLEEALLTWAHLEGAGLIGAHLEAALINEAHLEGALLTGAHLEGAFLMETHLEGARLGEARLERANLSGAHLEGAVLYRAVYDDETEWPDDFDHVGAGALHISEEDGLRRPATQHEDGAARGLG